MFLAEIEKRTSTNGTVSLYAIGDTHADRKEFDRERFDKYVAHICADPLSVAVFVGDALDGRIPGRKHFDPDTVRVDFLENLKSYVNHGLDVCAAMFRPLIKAKVPLVLISGNHDEYLEEIGFTAALCQRLGAGVHYLGGEGFIRLRTGNPRKQGGMYSTRIYATHGTGGGKTPGPKVNAMQRTFEWVDADVVMAGHVHDGNIRIIPSYGVPTSGALELVTTPRVMYRAPSFVRRSIAGVVGYQGKKGYPSSDEGLQYVRLDPHNRRATRLECEF
jgi:predicted phosphodiesterase